MRWHPATGRLQEVAILLHRHLRASGFPPDHAYGPADLLYVGGGIARVGLRFRGAEVEVKTRYGCIFFRDPGLDQSWVEVEVRDPLFRTPLVSRGLSFFDAMERALSLPGAERGLPRPEVITEESSGWAEYHLLDSRDLAEASGAFSDTAPG